MDEVREEFLYQLGQRLKTLRVQKGMTQSELAARCGKDQQSYERLERGKVSPTLWYLQHVAVALEVELSELLPIDLPKPTL